MERDPADVVAVNNKALCLMYLRDLSDSIKVLENSLERVPTVALNETLVVNLCSMYELAYVNHSEIKRTLSNWIARVAPDDFDASSANCGMVTYLARIRRVLLRRCKQECVGCGGLVKKKDVVGYACME
ncbi:hypothetical protein GOBAR_DD05334 [Gossypium barbadense]|nr:hypothetical protein GOBAR_DD05334 [Gossypium barbadense]